MLASALLAVLSALAVGLLPAWQATSTNVRGDLGDGKGQSGSTLRPRLRQLLIAGQAAMVLMVVAGAALLVRSAIHLQQVSLGFDTSQVLRARIGLPATQYRTPERVRATFQDLTDRLSSAPGVALAAIDSQGSWVQNTMDLMVRPAAGDPTALAGVIRSTVRDIDPTLPVYAIGTMDEALRRTTSQARFNMLLMSLLGATGLFLAALGIYSVIAWLVAQRTREIGVRMALGASPAAVVRQMVAHGLAPVMIGLVAGLGGAIAAGRLLEGQLFQVSARDPVTLGAAAVLLLLVATVAALVPARRASERRSGPGPARRLASRINRPGVHCSMNQPMETLFSACSTAATIGWLLLIVAPRWRWTQVASSTVIPLGIACCLPRPHRPAHARSARRGFGSLADVAALFSQPGCCSPDGSTTWPSTSSSAPGKCATPADTACRTCWSSRACHDLPARPDRAARLLGHPCAERGADCAGGRCEPHRRVVAELHRRDRVLALSGWLMVAGLLMASARGTVRHPAGARRSTRGSSRSSSSRPSPSSCGPWRGSWPRPLLVTSAA